MWGRMLAVCLLGASGCIILDYPPDAAPVSIDAPPDACVPMPADTPFPDVPFGATGHSFVLNPVVNDVTSPNSIPRQQGSERGCVAVSSADGFAVRTDERGVAIGAHEAGERAFTFDGETLDFSTFPTAYAAGTFSDWVIAASAGDSFLYVGLDLHLFSAVRVTPDMTTAEIEAALAMNERTVVFDPGEYVGDLHVAGGAVRLVGAELARAAVTIRGSVTMTERNGAIRGLHVTGSVSLPPDTIVMYSRIDGALSFAVSENGPFSSAIVVASDVCGGASFANNSVTAVGNRGLAPMPNCP
jgi:hypothetical protein